MTTALVPHRPEPAPGHIQLAASNVACNLRATQAGAPNRSATYELSLANDAAVAVSGRLFGIDRKRREQTFGVLEVAAHSVGRSMFAVPTEWSRTSDHLYMEVVGDGVHLVAEAQPLGPRARTRPIAAISWAILGTSLMLALTAAIALLGPGGGLTPPSILTLAVPQVAAPGHVNVFYAISGKAKASYRATLANGTPLASGVLDATSGDFAISVPPAAANGTVNVTLDARGPLGHATRSAAFTVNVPTRVVAPAQITSLTARREAYDGAQNALVSYAAAADGGVVRIVDAQGAVLGSAPFSHAGTNRIPLPDEAASETVRAQLHITRGGTHADASVELPVSAESDAAAARLLTKALRGAAKADAAAAAADGTNGPSTDVAGTSQQDGGSTPLPNDPFYVPGRVVGGRSFEVAIRRALPHMHVALQDEMGTNLDDRAVPAGATSVTLDAPQTTVVQTYYVAATFVKADGEETIVRSLRIFPR